MASSRQNPMWAQRRVDRESHKHQDDGDDDSDGKAEAKADATPTAPSEDEAKAEHIEALEEFASFVAEEGLLDDITGFLASRISKILPDEGDEFGHDAYACYQEYVGLVEARLESYMESLDITPKQFQVMCRALMETTACVVVEGSKVTARNFLSAFIASWEFEAFVEMAKRYRGRRAKAAAAESHGSGDAMPAAARLSALGARGRVKTALVTQQAPPEVRVRDHTAQGSDHEDSKD